MNFTHTATIFGESDVTTPDHYGPSNTALLLLDWFSLFIEKLAGESAGDALKAAVELRKWARSTGITVVHGLIDANLGLTTTAKNQSRLKGLLETMRSAQEPADLLDGRDEAEKTFTRKPGHISALKSPGLLEYLQERNIKSLIITGLSTSGCVTRTALAATDAEFVVTVISDACADSDQELHDVLIKKIFPSRGFVATAQQFREAFRS